jgi:hypothetical protein
MGALFWTACGLLIFARALTDGLTPKGWVALGVCAALATATKDSCYAAFVPAGAILAIEHLRSRAADRGDWTAGWRAPLVAFFVATAVYLTASGLIFRPSRFIKHFRFITHGSPGGLFYFRHPPTLAGYWQFLLEFVQQLVDSMGVPMLIAAAAGIVWWAITQPRRLLWLLPAAGVTIGVILPVRFVLLRFVLIITYVLAFAAADLLAASWRKPGTPRRWSTAALLVVVVGWSWLRGADLTYQMLNDGRHQAAAWLRDVTRRGDRVGHMQLAHYLPPLPSGVRPYLLDSSSLTALATGSGPEFLVSMPLEDYEREHEQDLPDAMYQALRAGTMGYHEARLFQSPSLFGRRPATFVNPPTRIFVRNDVWQARRGGAGAATAPR